MSLKVIKYTIGDKELEYIDDYNLLDMTVKQASQYPEFVKYYRNNCSDQLNTRMTKLEGLSANYTRYSSKESDDYCKCTFKLLSNHKIKDIMDANKRKKISLDSCIKKTFKSLKQRKSKKKNNTSIKHDNKTSHHGV